MQLCCKAPTPILQRMCYGDPVWPGVLWGVGVRGSHEKCPGTNVPAPKSHGEKTRVPPPKHATRSGHRVGTAFSSHCRARASLHSTVSSREAVLAMSTRSTRATRLAVARCDGAAPEEL